MSEPDPGPVTLFGAEGSPPVPPVTSTIGTFEVSRSGESIFYRPTDAQGAPLAVTGLRSTDDMQVVGLVGVPASTSLTLAIGDQVTAPIPLQPTPPLTSFVATAILPQPGTYDLSFSYSYIGVPQTGHACTRTLVQIFDGPTQVGSLVLDQSKYPDKAVDLLVPDLGVFKAIGSYPISTGTLTVWLSGDAGNGPVLAGNIRIVPHGSTDPDLIGYIDPSPVAYVRVNGNLAGKVTLQRYGSWTPRAGRSPRGPGGAITTPCRRGPSRRACRRSTTSRRRSRPCR